MTKIVQTYSKENIAINPDTITSSQQEALNEIKNGFSDCYDFSAFDDNMFLGSKNKVEKKYEKLKTSSNQQDIELVQLIDKYGGIDNIFKLLDADNNGKVSKQELKNVAATDTSEMAEKDDEVFSARDLYLIYENVMKTQDAKVETQDNTVTIEYKDGSKTTLEYDQNKKQLNSKTEERKESVFKEVTKYSYNQNLTEDRIIDSDGNEIFYSQNFPGKNNDKIVKTIYSNRGEKTVITETAGTSLEQRFDKDGNLIKEERKLNFKIDGIIKNTKQQSIGDCYVLAGVNALNNTKNGRKIISESIHQNPDGSVTVELKGVGKKYTFSPDEVGGHDYTDNDKSFAEGDIDMILIEMAVMKYRQEIMPQDDKNKSGRFSEATNNDPLNGGYLQDIATYMTDKPFTKGFRDKTINKILDEMINNPERYAVTTQFMWNDKSFEGGEIKTAHAYTIKRATSENVYIVNPWNSEEEIEYPRERFLKHVLRVVSTDMGE